MSKLERTSIGAFNVEEAIQIDELTAETLSRQLQPTLAAVANLPRVTLTEAQLLEVRNGRPILAAWLCSEPSPFGRRQVAQDSLWRGGSTLDASHRPSGDLAELAAVDAAGSLAAILFEKRPGELWPRLNFSRSS